MLLPYVLTDDVGLYKSFFPIIGYNKREESREEVMGRILIVLVIILLIISGYVFWDYVYYSLSYLHGIYRSIIEWGYDKMNTYHHGNSVSTYNYKVKHEEYMRNIGDN